MKWILATLLMIPPVMAQSDVCKSAFATLQRTDTIVAFEYVSGAAHFMEVVKGSPIGKTLAGCPSIADIAWDTILKAGQDGAKKAPTFTVAESTGALLAIYGDNLTTGQFEKLKEFIRLRPWRNGFGPFTPSIAVDVLLAYEKDPSRDNRYHAYTDDQMETALKKYAQ